MRSPRLRLDCFSLSEYGQRPGGEPCVAGRYWLCYCALGAATPRWPASWTWCGRAMLGHDFARSLGHQHETVEVAVPALPLRAPHEVKEHGLLARLQEPRQARIEQHRIFQFRHIGYSNTALVAICAITAQSAVGR